MPRPLLHAARAAIAAGLLALLWHVADGAAMLEHLARAHPGWLAAAVAALTAQTLLSALRWRLTASRMGIILDRRTAVREYYLSQLVNQALPGGVLGDAGRAVRSRAQAGLLASGQAVVFERLAGQIALLLLFAAAVGGTLAVPGGFDWPGWLLSPVLLALGSAGGGALLIALVGARLPGRLGRAVAGPGRAFLRATWAPGTRRRQAALSLGTATCNVAAFACCTAAIGVPLPAATALALIPLILFTMLIPVTVSGWGLREGAAVALLPLAGATAAEGLAASVAFGLTVLAAALPGVLAAGIASSPQARPPRGDDAGRDMSGRRGTVAPVQPRSATPTRPSTAPPSPGVMASPVSASTAARGACAKDP